MFVSNGTGMFRAQDVLVLELDFIPDLLAARELLSNGGDSAVLESGDAKGYSYVCCGEESPRFERGSDSTPFSIQEPSIESIRRRFTRHEPSTGERELRERFPGIFTGGGVGFFSYDFARTLERLPSHAQDDLQIPYVRLFFPSVILVARHSDGTSLVVLRRGSDTEPGASLEDHAGSLASQLSSLPRYQVPTPTTSGRNDEPQIPPGYRASMSEEEFVRVVDRTIDYIREGDVFQANLSIRLQTSFRDTPSALYRSLRDLNPSPYMTLLEFDDLAVVGASPEQLVRVSGRDIATRPIAGTRRRGRTGEEEVQKERELLSSEKERAEHLMLVDLERNDIGRVAEYGSVTVDEFMSIERYSHVVHIVSNVTGRLAAGKDRFDALGALFPGGTITGAPKVRAMEIIDELEPVRRGIYTGSVGWIGYGPDMEMNIAIRSILLRGGSAWVQAGAGVVADSIGELEYRESLKKLAASIAAIEAVAGREG